MSKTIQRYFQVEAREAEGGEVTVIASAPVEDRMGDIVEAPWKLERFARNPVIQWAHDYSLPPVGRATDISVENGVLMASIEFDESEENPLGRTVASQMRRGFLNAVSVGFAPGESVRRNSLDPEDPRFAADGFIYRNSELLEISVVPIPANPHAVALRSAVRAMDPRSTVERAQEALRCPEMRRELEAALLAEPVETRASSSMLDEVVDAMSDVFGPDPISTVFGHCDRDTDQP